MNEKLAPNGNRIRVGALVYVGNCPDLGTITARFGQTNCAWFVSFNGEKADPLPYSRDIIVVVGRPAA